MSIQSGKDRRRTVRIPVDAALLYRTVEARTFKLCRVLNVSTHSLEMLLDQPLPENTVVTIAVPSEGSARRFYTVTGQVMRLRQCSWQLRLFHEGEGGWVHVIAASVAQPWSPMFIYDVICSTFYPAPKNPVVEYETPLRKRQHADLQEHYANLDAWGASVMPARPLGIEKCQ